MAFIAPFDLVDRRMDLLYRLVCFSRPSNRPLGSTWYRAGLGLVPIFGPFNSFGPMARFWLPQFVPHSLKRFWFRECCCWVDFRWTSSTGLVDLLFQRLRLPVDWKCPVSKDAPIYPYLVWRFRSQIDGMRVWFPMLTSGAFNAPVLSFYFYLF